jgi:AMP-binding enzyme C-terminal domain
MAQQNKTTKEILQAKLAGRKRTPLYDRGSLEKLRQGFESWKRSVVRKEDRQNWHATPHPLLGSEIPREMLYTPLRSTEGFGDEYRIIITREKTMDELIVQAEYAKGVDSRVITELRRKLEAELKARGLRALVQMMEPDQLEGTEFKAKRVIDKRSLYDEITKQ